MTAYYNEFDPFAAAWLAELMADGLIAPGVIDTRSIVHVQPTDLRGFAQVHLFAGIGIWSAAARSIGWPDDRPLWSASCPCPPFSSAGAIKACPECQGTAAIPDVRATGQFLCGICGHSWIADMRHLWPEVWRLIRDERPSCVVGEQVASADGRTWLDLVRASLEVLAYDAWGVDTCAAGFGSPNIRQRLYWAADTFIGVDNTNCARSSPSRSGQPDEWKRGSGGSQLGREVGELANAIGKRREGEAIGSEPHGGGRSFFSSSDGGMANAHGQHSGEAGTIPSREQRQSPDYRGPLQTDIRSGPLNGLWSDADWIGCTDGRWRPVEPGTFPLAPARTFRNRVAELRGAGNAVNLAQAAGFLAAIAPEIACDTHQRKAPDPNRRAEGLSQLLVADASGEAETPLTEPPLHSQDTRAHTDLADAGSGVFGDAT